jgi:hypothetical protein
VYGEDAMASAVDKSVAVEQTQPVHDGLSDQGIPMTLRHRLTRILWDTFDYPPEERRLIFKIDFFIL